MKLPVRLLVVGGGQDEKTLRSLTEDPLFADRLTVTGSVPYDDVPQYVRAMDVCALPKLGRIPGSSYDYSASPLKAFEYMAAGKAIVTNDVADFRFLVDCGAALAADIDDPEAFAGAIEQLVTDGPMREQLSEAGLRYARTHGSWAASIERVNTLLQEVVER